MKLIIKDNKIIAWHDDSQDVIKLYPGCTQQWAPNTFVPVNEDGTFVPVPSAVVPTSVTARQFRLALNQLSLRSAIDAAVAAADQNTKDTWEYSNVFERDNPMLLAMATALGKTTEEIDAVFILASTL